MHKIEFSQSKTGLPTVKVDGIQYHSTYNPEREASRFLNSVLSTFNSKYPMCIIIIGAGLGYLDMILKRINSSIKVVNICLSEEFLNQSSHKPINTVVYKSDIELLEYLKTTVAEFELPGLRIIEWPPALKAFPQKIKAIRKVILNLTQEYSGNFKTTMALGKRWIKNSFLNFLFFNDPIKRIHLTNSPAIVITASGPSLENSLALIKAYREHIFLIALPSSLPIYSLYKIQPDLLALTDPGYYSAYHLSFYPRNKLNLLMPYSGVTGLWGSNFSFLPFLQTNFFEIELARKAGLQLSTIPSQGTVAATALNYAISLNPRVIIFAGLDFCFYDVFSHTRASGTDYYFYLESNKLNPYLTQKIHKLYSEKHLTLNGNKNDKTKYYISQSLHLYSTWFNNVISKSKPPIFRLNPSPVKLHGFININKREFESVVTNVKKTPIKKLSHKFRQRNFIIEYYEESQYPDFIQRKRILKNLLGNWINDLISLKKAKNGSVLLNNTFLNMAYYFDLKKLSEIKQNIIENNYKRATELSMELNESIITFLNKFLKML